MIKFACCLAVACIAFAGCDNTTKDKASTETTHTNADGKTAKTETTVEKKTTVDK